MDGSKFIIASNCDFCRPFGKTGDVVRLKTEKNRHAFLLTAIPFEDGYTVCRTKS